MIAFLLNLCYAFILVAVRRAWLKLILHPSPAKPASWPAVSVIIAVRNEERHLDSFIQSLSKQDYPGIKEIIFIDDCSSDNTAVILGQTDFKIIRNDQHSGKKASLTEGIMAGSGEWILTTDADCMHSPEWISTLIARGHSSNAVMVCGLVHMSKPKKFIEEFQAMEMMMLQVSGSACIDAGMPLLNSAASLAFRRDAWLAAGGYQEHLHIPSGDDTFLLFDLDKKYPGRIATEPSRAANVSTQPLFTWKEIFIQRMRWTSKVPAYRNRFVTAFGILILLAAASELFVMLSIPYHPENLSWFIAILLVRLIAEIRLLNAAMLLNNYTIKFASKLKMSVVYPMFAVALVAGRIFYRGQWKR